MCGVGVDAVAVVADGEFDVGGGAGERDVRCRGVRVVGDVGERLDQCWAELLEDDPLDVVWVAVVADGWFESEVLFGGGEDGGKLVGRG